MAKPQKGDAASTTSSKKSTAASIKSSLSSVAKKATKAFSSTKRKAEKLLSPKGKKKQKKNDASSAPAKVISISEDDSSDSEPVVEVNQKTTMKKGKDGDVNASASKEDREELIGMMKSWKSPVYSFFAPVPKIEYINDRRKGVERKAHTFKCWKTGCKFTCHRYLDSKTDRTSTSNLSRHAKTCWKDAAFKAAMGCKTIGEARTKVLEPFNVQGTLDLAFEVQGKGKVTYMARNHTKTEIKAEIVRWLSESVRPFKTVEDRGFKCLMKTGRPELYLPSASTVSRDVKLVFARTRERIAKMLQEYNGRLNFATDAWTSPNHRTYVAVTVHMELNGEMISMVLDVVEVAESHTGLNLALAFKSILEDFGIEHKILSVTCDNASNNDTMVAEMHERIAAFNKVNRTRCFLHVLNLVAKALLRQFELPEKKDFDLTDEERKVLGDIAELADGIQAEEDATRKEQEADIDGDDLDPEDLEEWLDEIKLTPEEEEELRLKVVPITRMLVKLRKLAFKIVHSTTILLPAWKALLVKLELAARIMPRDVKTRWNSTYDMLAFAIEYKDALKELTGDLGNGLQAFELNDDEWELAEELANVLEYLKDGTLFFSHDSPNLQAVIPAMDRIDEYFTNRLTENSLNVAMRSAIIAAKATLNKYYELTDHAEVYRIAMVLHPRFKLRYFKKAGWDEEWIKMSRQFVEDKLDRHYSVLVSTEWDNEEAGPGEADEMEGSETSKRTKSKKRYIFDETDDSDSNASDGSSITANEELELYLSTKPEKNVTDPIRWWKEKQRTYPRLSQMAIDYLTIPGESSILLLTIY
ncbi:hypothetical protein CVT26_004180 [Gymnopilus dilepis]|uniref:HAT C-terminal dimerisation domain-containing protein n=1 Tax=Gymnopilus dilepis TaxID=231916 RepID=A0A409X1L4_9AGAR|nr:hypothetical protein CVT26_004180 [Gymnopilus dilepis]